MLNSEKHNICCFILASVLLCGTLIIYFLTKSEDNANGHSQETLRLVHVIVRHGDRNPEHESLRLLSSPYQESDYPEGLGQLTKKGKQKAYDVGRYLRARYDNFLPKIWNIKHLEAQTTAYNRTKVTALLILAGLYPENGEIWSRQAIPYNYIPKHLDKEMLGFLICPRYYKLNNKLYDDGEFRENVHSKYNATFDFIAQKTNKTVDLLRAFYVYDGIKIQRELGLSVASWTDRVYPEPLNSLALDMYLQMTNSTEIRRVTAGYFLKKLLNDSEDKIRGSERKMYLYSAHEMNIATLLIALGLAKLADVPPYGSFILFELHEIDGTYGIKIFYQDFSREEPVPLSVEGCAHFCPFHHFYRLLKRYLPLTDDECFNKNY